jgi:hypothetical protein
LEQELAACGVALALPHRLVWTEITGRSGSWFLAVRGPGGKLIGGLAAEVRKSRAIPGYRTLRVERFGEGASPEVMEAVVVELARVASHTPRILHVSVETLCRDWEKRELLSGLLARAGFRRWSPARRYTETLVVDLTPSEEEIFAGLDKSARRTLRQGAPSPLELHEITSERHLDRMNELYRETMRRTNGRNAAKDLGALIRLSIRAPSLARVVGISRRDVPGPEGLIAFAIGCGHGPYAHYDEAASTRVPDLRAAPGYILLWDLIRWAKRSGCAWFDLGGITGGTLGGSDPLGGISHFKRYFSKELLHVGDEWRLEPHFVPSALARVVRSGFGLLHG